MLTHNEPIRCNSTQMGFTSAVRDAHTFDTCAAIGNVNYGDRVRNDLIYDGDYNIEQANQTYSASTSLAPKYDLKDVRTQS